MTNDYAGDLLDALDTAINEHMAWTLDWFRAALAGSGFDSSDLSDSAEETDSFSRWISHNSSSPLLDQPAFHALVQLHQDARTAGRDLARRIEAGQEVGAYELAAFSDQLQQFHVSARRLEKAFGAAASELDTLTGLYNRTAMRRELERERERSLRTGLPCTIALADLDHFKAINDDHGHAAGDRVLQMAAEIFSQNVRPFDHVFRYGGEEFLICLPNADLEQADIVLERVRTALAAILVDIGEADPISVTASFGAAPTCSDIDLNETIELADKALYQAKETGRNRVEISKG
ncbi:diguanylate cyclase [Alphaproteobacteria bacterium HT1-32]|nr:diguanylate cyclase [Alphaproteobacteria bacterium HT1-32]